MEQLHAWLAPLTAYPHWFAMTCLVIVAAVVAWLAVKILKWSLWLILIAVLLAGGAVVFALIFH